MTTTLATLDRLLAAGGSLWEKGDLRRVYFNDLPGLFGLDIAYYNSGSVSSAKLDGKTISNTEAKRIASDLAATKLWVDLDTQAITVRASMRYLVDYDYVYYLTEALAERLKA